MQFIRSHRHEGGIVRVFFQALGILILMFLLTLAVLLSAFAIIGWLMQ